jgi:hypothetical protein
MTKTTLAIIIATITCAGAVAAVADTANARPWMHRCCRAWVSHPRLYAYRSYPRHIHYYRNACGYGDCTCIRGYALATGAQVWWDRYQACTGR